MSNRQAGRTTVWGLLAVAVLASGAGSAFDLYGKFWWYDEALHGYFSFALTLVLALYVYGALLTGRHRHKLLLVLTVAGLGLTCGALWEIAEWVYDQIVRPDAILGKTDTIVDLIVGALGAVAGALVGLRMLKK